MNYRIDKDGYITIYCHQCKEEIQLADLLKVDNNLLCAVCKAHLGYVWDLPSWALNYLQNG